MVANAHEPLRRRHALNLLTGASLICSEREEGIQSHEGDQGRQACPQHLRGRVGRPSPEGC